MPIPHPLNQAVIAQAMHDLQQGNLRRCLSMGFGESDLSVLKQPTLISVLLHASVPWCSVQVNRDVMQRLLRRVETFDQDVEMIDRMLQLGTSTDMVSRFYGLTHQEVALRRKVLDLPKRKGRHPMLSEAQDTALWEQWHPEIAKRGIALNDDIAMLELVLDLAKSMNLPACVIWAAVHQWIAQGLVK